MKKQNKFKSKEFLIGVLIIVSVVYFAVYSNSISPSKTSINFQETGYNKTISFAGIVMQPLQSPVRGDSLWVSCTGELKSYQFTNLSEKGAPNYKIPTMNVIAIYDPTYFKPLSYVSCENDNGAIILKLDASTQSMSYATIAYK